MLRGFTGLDEVSLVVSQVESLLFYLVGASGRRLQEDVTLVQSGIGPDSSLFMAARLKGGSMERVLQVPCAATDAWASFFSSQTGKGDATFGQGAVRAEIWQSHGWERLCSFTSASTCS